MHFPYHIVEWGSPRNFDTISSERAHKSVKKAFKKTSQRKGKQNEEIVTRIQTNEILGEAFEQGKKILGDSEVSK